MAKKLEGCARHASTHACGVVISAHPLDDLVPLQHPTQSDKAIVTQYELHAIDDLGLLKMDFLGLKNLTIIEDTLKRIYKVQDKSIDLNTIPLNDKKTFDILKQAVDIPVLMAEYPDGGIGEPGQLAKSDTPVGQPPEDGPAAFGPEIKGQK